MRGEKRTWDFSWQRRFVIGFWSPGLLAAVVSKCRGCGALDLLATNGRLLLCCVAAPPCACAGLLLHGFGPSRPPAWSFSSYGSVSLLRELGLVRCLRGCCSAFRRFSDSFHRSSALFSSVPRCSSGLCRCLLRRLAAPLSRCSVVSFCAVVSR